MSDDTRAARGPAPSITATQLLLARRAPLHASLSPDGSLLALTTSSLAAGTEDETISFTLVDVATGDERPVPGAGADDRIGVWSPDGNTLAVLTEREGTTTLSVIPFGDASGAGARVLFGAAHVVGPPVWSPDGRTIAVPCRRGEVIDRTRPYRWSRPIPAFDGLGPLEDPPQIRLVDVASGEGRWVTDDGWRWGMPRWSPDGTRLAAVASLDPTGRQVGQFLRIIDVEPSGTSEPHAPDVPDVPGGRTLVATWLADGRLVVLIGEPRDRPSGTEARIVVVDGDDVGVVTLRGGVRLLGDVYGDNPAELADSYETVLLADTGSSVIVRTGSRGRMGIARLDVDSGTIDVLVDGDRCASPIAAIGDVLVFTTQSCERPVELAVVPLVGDGGERQLTSCSDGGPTRVVARRFVVAGPSLSNDQHAAGGLELDAWFLRDVDAGDGPLPTVLVVHGGPQFAFGESFNVDVHALCAAGFGVLYTNPRGSTGWGDAFAHAVHSDWADGPTQDVLAVVDHAIAEGWVDGARLGVTGNSYGGYLSAWLSATTDRFRAAVIENPVTDLVAMWGTSDIGFGFFSAQFGGPPRDRMDVYVAQSPLHQAHRSTTPSLFVVGEVDRRCPPAQAWAMHRVLVSVGTPSEVLVLPGSTHEGSTYGPPAARFAHDDALVEWMTRWVGVG